MNERKFINEAVKKLLVSEFIRKETENAGFGGMELKRTPFGTNITLYVNKPGLVIGRHGAKVQAITENLERIYGIESPQIEVKEIDNPDLNPQVVSKKIALSLEKGWAYRKAGNTSLRRIVESGARGVMISISGKISGERGRMQKFMSGSVKYSGEPARAGMERGFSIAKMKLGVIGVKVGILRHEYKLPDDYMVSEELGVVTPQLIQEEAKPAQGEKKPAAPSRPQSRGRPPARRERGPPSPRDRRPERPAPAGDRRAPPRERPAADKPVKREEAEPKAPVKKDESPSKEKAGPAEAKPEVKQETKPAAAKKESKPKAEKAEPAAGKKAEVPAKAKPEAKSKASDEKKPEPSAEAKPAKKPEAKAEARADEQKEAVKEKKEAEGSGAESETTERNE